MKKVNTDCLNCGFDMRGRWFSICPNCGRYMATRTTAEIITIYAVGIIVGFVVVIGLVVLLWNFA